MVENGKLPDSYESLVAQFDLEDELIAEAGSEDEIDIADLFTVLSEEEV